MIDVIIPAYNAHNTIMKTLSSIVTQTMVEDLNIIIVNDASTEDYSKEISCFKSLMKIKEIKLEKNSGPGVARQTGIDKSKNPYIIFIDSDDIFSSPFSIAILYNSIIENDYDMISSYFYQEHENGEYSTITEDRIWLHGKIYKRKFIEENNIRFNNTSSNEDNGFNQLIYLHESKINYIDDFTYIWSFNKNSITRKNNYRYKYAQIDGYIDNITWALEIVINKNIITEKIAELSYRALLAVYSYYIEFLEESDIDKILTKSKKLKSISDKYVIDDLEYKNYIYIDQLMCLQHSFRNISLSSSKLNFVSFLKLVDES